MSDPTAPPQPGLPPEHAAAVALMQAKADDDRVRERDETIMAAVVATPYHPVGAKYTDKLFDNLGLSYLSILALGAVVFGVVQGLKLPGTILFLFEAGVLGLLIWRFIQQYVRKP